MASKAFDGHRKRLAEKRKTIGALVTEIEEHEHEREDAAQHRTHLTDPKYKGSSFSASLFPPENEDSLSKTSSGEAAERQIKNMLESESEKKARIGKKKAPGIAKPAAPAKAEKKTQGRAKAPLLEPTPPPTPEKQGLRPMNTIKPILAKRRRSSTFKGNDSAEEFSSGKRASDASKEDDVHLQIEDEEESDEEEGFFHIIEALRSFENTGYIFMHRLLDYIEIEAAGVFKTDSVDIAYQILNVEGQLLFLLTQNKIRCTGFIVYAKKSFENILYDIYGNKVLKYIGPSVFMSKMTSRMVVTDKHNRMLGYIKAFGTKVNYSVYNAIGERLFLVVSNLYIPHSTTHFTILCRGQKIGVIKFGWKHTFPDLNYIDYETSGVSKLAGVLKNKLIEFPPEMDEREKALLLGCLMLIVSVDFFWYSPLTRLKLSLLFVGIFLVTLAIIIICIPLIVDSPDADKTTKTYYASEHKPKLKKEASTRTDQS